MLAKRLRAQVVLVTAHDPSALSRPRAERVVRAGLAEAARRRVPATTELVPGKPTEAILELAGSEGADVVVGNKGMGQPRPFRLGSVPDRIAPWWGPSRLRRRPGPARRGWRSGRGSSRAIRGPRPGGRPRPGARLTGGAAPGRDPAGAAGRAGGHGLHRVRGGRLAPAARGRGGYRGRRRVPLGRVLGEPVGGVLAAIHRDHWVEMHWGETVAALEGSAGRSGC